MTFFQKFQEMMKKKHISQAALAKKLQVSQPTIWEWAHTKTPSLERFEQICIALQTTPNELLGVNEQKDCQDSEESRHF